MFENLSFSGILRSKKFLFLLGLIFLLAALLAIPLLSDSQFLSDRPEVEYSDLVDFDPDSIPPAPIDMFEERVQIESMVPGYEISFTKEGIFEYNHYMYRRGFWKLDRVSRTYSSEEVQEIFSEEREEPFVPEFITAENLLILLVPYSDSAKVYSGNEVDMSLDYETDGNKVTFYIGVKQEDLNDQFDLVEKTFGALIFQGAHISTYVANSEGRSQEEYPFTPYIFYKSLKDSYPNMIEISRTTSSVILGALERIGIIKRAYAYCAGSSVCSCGIDPMPDECDDPYDTYNAPCWWDSGFGGCVNLAANCGMEGSNCYWVNPPPPPPPDDCVEDGGQCDRNADCCPGLECRAGSISGICMPMDDPPDECVCSCQWFCGDITHECDDCCTAVNLPTPEDQRYWCDDDWISACLPDYDCGGEGGSDIQNWIVGRVYEGEPGAIDFIYSRGRDCNDCDQSWQNVGNTYRVYVEQHDGTPHEPGWYCNPCPYYSAAKKTSMAGDWWNVVLEPPPGREICEWKLTYPSPVFGDPLEYVSAGADCCDWFNDGSCKSVCGPGCEAHVMLTDTAWMNHLHWWVRDCPHSPVTCGNLRTDDSCVVEEEGMVIDVYLDSPNAEEVWFPTWTHEGGQDDLVWYEGTKVGDDLWTATIDLKNHPGWGTVHIHSYADNCATEEGPYGSFCGAITVEKVSNPQMPDNLDVEVICGSVPQRRSAFFRWEYYDDRGYIPPASVLRVDYTGTTWFGQYDAWKWVPTAYNEPCTRLMAIFHPYGSRCTFFYDHETPRQGGAGLIEGNYRWNVQSIDSCTLDHTRTSVITDDHYFDCYNDPPECTNPSGPTSIFGGQTRTYSAQVFDSVDPVEVIWWADCENTSGSGSFDPSSQNINDATGWPWVYTDWTAPHLTDPEINGSCTIHLMVWDGLDWATCNSASITIGNPTVEGSLYRVQEGEDCLTIPTGFPQGRYLAYWLNGDYGMQISSTYPPINSEVSVNHSSPPRRVYTNYSTTAFPYESQIEYFNFLYGVDPYDSLVFDIYDVALDAVCVENYMGGTLPDEGDFIPGLTFDAEPEGPGPILRDNMTVNIGYEIYSVLDGWWTSLNGSVYSGDGVSMVVSSNPAAWQGGYMTNDFAFSRNEFDVTTFDPVEDRISTENYAQYLEDGIKFYYARSSDYQLEGLIDIEEVGDFNDLEPSQIYRTEVSVMNDILSNEDIAANYGARISENGIVVIYVTSTSSDSIIFTRNFITTNQNRKILIVSSEDVVFDPGIGDEELLPDPPNGAHVQVGIISGGNIYFPSSITVRDHGDEGYDPYERDSAILFHGSLFARGNIDFSRDTRLGSQYPAQAVYYDSSYTYYLQRQMNEHSLFERHFFSLVSISWDVEN